MEAKTVYGYDEKNIFSGEVVLDETDKSPAGNWNIPAYCTEIEPPAEQAGYARVFNGEAWEYVEDHRGERYWLSGDKYGDPGRVMDELGQLPEGATTTEPEQTDEEKKLSLQKEMTAAVQRVLDNEAQKLGYDSCLSVCSYVDTGVQKFDDEGAAFRAWRSQVWAKGYEILDEVKAGTREIPTEEELLAEMPKLALVYSS